LIIVLEAAARRGPTTRPASGRITSLRITIDTDARRLAIDEGSGNVRTLDLYGRDAFEMISSLWLKTGWNQKYSYTFTWLGRPIIQHPEDLVRLQEVIYHVAPDVIVETGVAHGGSLVFHASLLKAIGRGGRVIGIDVEIRPHNRHALEAHVLAPMITLIEGDSVAVETVAAVRGLIGPSNTVLVVLDSNHTKGHVLAELERYHPLVTPDSYIVATDGIMRDLYDVPRGRLEWREDNPAAAAETFAANHPEFVLESPAWHFNESDLQRPVTCWPSAWLRRTTRGS
jgi:cephalosporin hydroxylase